MTRRHVVGGMATMPGREAALAKALASIAPQLDELHLHVNALDAWRFDVDQLPDNVHLSTSHANRGDQEKLMVLRRYAPAYATWLFTLDDDIVYPPDYVETMIARSAPGCVLGVHGWTPEGRVVDDGFTRRVHHFHAFLRHPRRVGVIGTGTACFRPDLFVFDRPDFPTPNMADVWAAIGWAKAHVRLRVTNRPTGWLQSALVNGGPNIWDSSRRGDGSFLDTGAAQRAAVRDHLHLLGAGALHAHR